MNAKTILLITVAFGCGVAFGTLVLNSAGTAKGEKLETEATLVEKQGNRVATPVRSNAAKNSTATESDALVDDFKRSLTSPKSADRKGGLYRILAGLNRNNWGEIYDIFKARRQQGNHDHGEWEMFLNAAGAVDGAGIMKRLMEDQQPDMAKSPSPDYHYVLRTWVPANEAEADAWFNSMPKSQFRDGLYSGYLGGLAEVDLPRAIEGVENVEARYRHYFLHDLIPRVFQQGRGDEWLERAIALEERSGAKEQDYVRMVYGRVAAQVVQENAEAGNHGQSLEWLSKYQAKPFASSAPWEDMARRYATAQPEMAMKELESMYETNSAHLGPALGAGMVAWATNDPAKAQQWLAQQQEKPFYDQVAVQYIDLLNKTNPAEIGTWIDSLANPNTRESVRARYTKVRPQ